MRVCVLRGMILMAALGTSGGCALMANSTTQFIDVTSEPPGAQVLVAGRPAGETPLRVELPRRRSGVVLRFEKDGFRSAEHPLRRSVSRFLLVNFLFLARTPWNDHTWARWAGNALFWGLDFATGGAFAFPSRVDAKLIATPRRRQLLSRLIAAETRSAAARFRIHRGAGTDVRPAPSGRAQ